MEKTIKTEVVIIGAGPTGLSLACQLVRYGIDFVIIERNEGVTPYSKAIGVHARTLEIYEQLGLALKAIEQGTVAGKGRLLVGGEVRGELDFSNIGAGLSPYPYMLMLEQSKNEKLLYEYLQSHRKEVLWRTELDSFSKNDSGVTVHLKTAGSSSQIHEAEYLVGCDGPKSVVRHTLGLSFEGSTFERMFYVADAQIDWELSHDALHICLSKDSFVVFFPLKGEKRYRIVGVFPEEFSKDEGDVLYEEIELRIKELAELGLDIHDVEWFSTYKVHTRHVSRFSQGRCFLAGDAAHVHSPAGAQGMNTGIQDAWNLGWKLALVARGLAAEALLDSYHAERWPVGRFVLRFTDRAFTLATSSGPLARVVRTRVAPRLAPLAARFGPGRALGFRAISQLGVRYRGSSAVQEGRPSPHGGPRAGDRLPDGPLARDRRPRWLHESLGGPGFHLLLCGPAEAWDGAGLQALGSRWGGLVGVHRLAPRAGPGVLHDDGTLLRRLGVAGTAQYLVRPDGHIGYRAAGTDLDGLQAYLEHWLPGAAALTRAP